MMTTLLACLASASVAFTIGFLCGHRSNRGILVEYRRMRDDGLLTDAECQSLRRAVLRFLGDD